MDPWSIIVIMINAALLVATGAAAVGTVVQAKVAVAARTDAQSAQSDAETARNEAKNLAAKANKMFERTALALERSNEIEEAKLPKPSVGWTIRPQRGSMFTVTNTGDMRAYDVKLTGTEGIHADEDSEADEVGPGDSLEFAVWQGGGMKTPRLTVTWALEPDGPTTSESVNVRPVK